MTDAVSIEVIDNSGIKELQISLGEFAVGKKLNQRLHRLIMNQMKHSIDRNFQEQGRPEKWKPLLWQTIYRRYHKNASGKKGTKKFETRFSKITRGANKGKRQIDVRIEKLKQRLTSANSKGNSAGDVKILQDTKRLRSSISIHLERLSEGISFIQPGVEYGVFHQMGAKHIPVRAFMLVQNEDSREIDGFLRLILNEALNAKGGA